VIAGDANAIRRHTIIDAPAGGFRSHRIEIKDNVEFRPARQKFRAVRGIRHEHHLVGTIGDVIAGMARGMAIGSDGTHAQHNLLIRANAAHARAIGRQTPRAIGEGSTLTFGAAGFIRRIAPPGDLRFRYDHFRIGESRQTFAIQQAIHVIAMEMAHDHTRHLSGINAGGLHIGNHAPIGRRWGGDAVATVKNHQIAASIEEGDSEGNYQAVLRQEGIAQDCLHLRQGCVAHKTFQGARKKTIMHGGHRERTNLEAVKAWGLDYRHRHRLRR